MDPPADCPPCPPEWSAAQALMVRETRVAYGPVARDIGHGEVALDQWSINGARFVLDVPGRRIGYARGEGITIEREPGAGAGNEALLLAGSVYAAVACLNGLVPIHASAVAHEGEAGGQVFAFTGPSGAGKSTLVAALGSRGLPLFCDDTLLLDLSRPDAIGCLPGHKRLKLTHQALALAGAAGEEAVAPDVAKVYARPAAGTVTRPLPLARLVFLERGEEPAILPLTGTERLSRLADRHYTTAFAAAALGRDPAAMFAHLARLSARIAAARFVRPWDTARFDAGADLAARYVTDRALGGRDS